MTSLRAWRALRAYVYGVFHVLACSMNLACLRASRDS